MPNRTYNASGTPAFNSAGQSIAIRAEFAAIAAAFAAIEAEIDATGTFIVAGEWVDPSYSEVYSSSTQFLLADVDATTIMTQGRRLRLTINGSFVYTEVVSSSFVSGDTVVTVLGSVLTNQLTLVEYSSITPYGQADCPLSLSQLQSIIDTQVAALTAVVASLVPIEVSTASGDVVKTLPTNAVHASYIHSTDDANIITFDTSDGSTIAETITLASQYERATFDKVGNIWYRG